MSDRQDDPSRSDVLLPATMAVLPVKRVRIVGPIFLDDERMPIRDRPPSMFSGLGAFIEQTLVTAIAQAFTRSAAGEQRTVAAAEPLHAQAAGGHPTAAR